MHRKRDNKKEIIVVCERDTHHFVKERDQRLFPVISRILSSRKFLPSSKPGKIPEAAPGKFPKPSRGKLIDK
jgi:hypothetical protein